MQQTRQHDKFLIDVLGWGKRLLQLHQTSSVRSHAQHVTKIVRGIEGFEVGGDARLHLLKRILKMGAARHCSRKWTKVLQQMGIVGGPGVFKTLDGREAPDPLKGVALGAALITTKCLLYRLAVLSLVKASLVPFNFILAVRLAHLLQRTAAITVFYNRL